MSLFAPSYVWQSVNVNGENIPYYTVGHGPAVVSIPGWAMSGSLHWRKAQAIASKGLRAIVVSQFTNRKDKARTFEELAERNWQALDLIGVDHPVISGHSMGGITAMHMATMRQDEVDQLWLFESAGGPSWKQSSLLSQRSAVSWWLGGLIPSAFQRCGPNFVLEFAKSALRNPISVWKQSNLVRYIDATEVAYALSQSKIKVQGIWATSDLLFPHLSQKSLAAALNIDHLQVPGHHGETLINPILFVSQLDSAIEALKAG